VLPNGTIGATVPLRRARGPSPPTVFEMADPHAQHRLGIVLVVSAAVAWSTSALFTRLLPFDPWTILFWRGTFGGSLVVFYMAATQGLAGLRDFLRMRRSDWIVAGLSTIGMLAFIPSLQLTSAANVAVIYAAFPFAAAALAWIWLRETLPLRTVLASLMALCGVAIIVWETGFWQNGGGSDIRGIGLALILTLSMAVMTVVARRYRTTPMVAAAALSNFMGSVISIPFAGAITAVDGRDLVVLALFGFFQVAMGLTLFLMGSRYLRAGQASLLATVETPLMPFWVWLVFRETPSRAAAIGGSLVMAAVVVEIVRDNLARRRLIGAPLS
jgi:drug/metabolite transporter (DMT)-like permease